MTKVKSFFANFREATVLLIVVVVSIILSFLSPYFFTWDNIRSVLIGMSCSAILAIGTTLVMASGAIDISLGAQLAMSGAIVGVLFIKGVPIVLAILVAIAACALVGFLNGVIISNTTLNPMICTLATQYVCQGIANVITTGSPQSLRSAPEFFSFIGKGFVGGSFPMIFLEFLILGTIVDILMLQICFGAQGILCWLKLAGRHLFRHQCAQSKNPYLCFCRCYGGGRGRTHYCTSFRRLPCRWCDGYDDSHVRRGNWWSLRFGRVRYHSRHYACPNPAQPCGQCPCSDERQRLLAKSDQRRHLAQCCLAGLFFS